MNALEKQQTKNKYLKWIKEKPVVIETPRPVFFSIKDDKDAVEIVGNVSKAVCTIIIINCYARKAFSVFNYAQRNLVPSN